MLTEADIGPIAAALDDQSAPVRHAALRLVGLLLPLISDDHLYDRVRKFVGSSDADASALAEKALGNASPPPLTEVPTGSRDQKPTEMTESGTPQQWRKTFNEATNVLERLFPAMRLAIAGEISWIESVLKEIETGPLNMDALRHVRWEGRHLVPAPGSQRLLQIANDTARRGDVRQIAWLLACISVDALESPYTPDLIEHAAEVTDHWLKIDRFNVYAPEMELLQYLESERGALLVTVLFERCLREVFEDQGYMAGNRVVQVVAGLGPKFVPDIPVLFELYLETFRHASAARADWYRTGDEYIVFTKPGHLAVGWQIAWTLARAGLLDMIAGLAPFLDSPDENERLAVLALAEDAIRYIAEPSPPLFGGVSAPATDIAVLVQGIHSTLLPAATDLGYKLVRVFYGTNRQPTGSRKPSQWFGFGEADLGLGVCDVTIPRRHEISKLESPSWYTVIHRMDPSRYIILQRVEPQSESTFCETLRDRVRSSKHKHALVFVHGYRVSFEDAARRAAQLSDDLEIAIPLFYSWPSRAKLRGYGADETLAQRAVQPLVRFLDLVSAQSGVEVIHLIAHSMGALALSRAVVNYLEARAVSATPTFREIILAAPDIDAEIFKNDIVPRIADKGPRLTLYASRRDYALLTSSWLRGGLSRAGFIEEGKPLVVRGVETIDVSAVNTEVAWGLLQGHSYVADRPAVVQDMFELLRFGKSAGERFGNKEEFLDNLRYWIMKRRTV